MLDNNKDRSLLSLPKVLMVEPDSDLAKEVLDELSEKAQFIWRTSLRNPKKIFSDNKIDIVVLGNQEARNIIGAAKKNGFKGIILANTGSKKGNKKLLEAGATFHVEYKDLSSQAIGMYL